MMIKPIDKLKTSMNVLKLASGIEGIETAKAVEIPKVVIIQQPQMTSPKLKAIKNLQKYGFQWI